MELKYGGSQYRKSFSPNATPMNSRKSALVNLQSLLLIASENSMNFSLNVGLKLLLSLPNGILNSPFELKRIWLLKA